MKKKRILILIIFIIIGAVLGTITGEVLGNFFPFLKTGFDFGFESLNLDLVFMKMKFGLLFKINIMTAFGVLLFLYLSTVL